MKYFISSLFLLYSMAVLAQQDSLPVYFIEEEDVVLEFDIRHYRGGKSELFSEVLEMDVDILEITKPPYFWTKNDWELLKVGKYIFQLRKEIEKCDDVLPWVQKYALKREPHSTDAKELKDTEDSFFLNRIFRNQEKIAKVSEDGNITFILPGYPNAEKVIITGNFNKWNESDIQMNRSEKGWVIKMDFPQGIFEYKFIVDGEWMHDPNNSRKTKNQHNTYNSILLVGNYMVFKLPKFLNAKRVVLSGSFNNWNTHKIQMEKSEDGWYTEVPLSPGKHLYKFIVDGKWMVDPVNQLSQMDKSGNLNSVVVIH